MRPAVLGVGLLSRWGGKFSELEGTALVSSSSDLSREVVTLSKLLNNFASQCPRLQDFIQGPQSSGEVRALMCLRIEFHFH